MNAVKCQLLTPKYTAVLYFTFGWPPLIINHFTSSGLAWLLHNTLYVFQAYFPLMCYNLDRNRHNIQYSGSIIVGHEYVLYHVKDLLIMVSIKWAWWTSWTSETKYELWIIHKLNAHLNARSKNFSVAMIILSSGSFIVLMRLF